MRCVWVNTETNNEFSKCTRHIAAQVTALPGVAGLHIMPVTAAGRAQALQLIEHNQLGSEGSAEKSRGADRNL